MPLAAIYGFVLCIIDRCDRGAALVDLITLKEPSARVHSFWDGYPWNNLLNENESVKVEFVKVRISCLIIYFGEKMKLQVSYDGLGGLKYFHSKTEYKIGNIFVSSPCRFAQVEVGRSAHSPFLPSHPFVLIIFFCAPFAGFQVGI